VLTFNILQHDGPARTGRLITQHGVIETPAFMTVGTLGAAKGLTPHMLREHGAQVILMNAFHLAWRPGEKLVRELGGLHRFSGWNGPILTDSGGFQIFSLPGLRTINEEGAQFAAPTDGTVRLFTPETVVELQCALGADMIMPLDQCPAYPFQPGELEEAVQRSVRWLARSVRRFKELQAQVGYAAIPTALQPQGAREAPAAHHDIGHVNLFGIVQGGFDETQRRMSIEETCAQDCAGFALGGFCVGEPPEATHAGIAYSAPLLPEDKPRYLMGMGRPEDVLHAVDCGMDLFDCTLPTRNGRNGMAFTSEGPLRLKNAKHARDPRPLDLHCNCYTCRTFSRAFLRHLFLAQEINACILASLHNVAFYLKLMEDLRGAIRAGRFKAFRQEWLGRYRAEDQDLEENI